MSCRRLFAGSKFNQNKALMQDPGPCLDIPEDEELKDVPPVPTKPAQVCKLCKSAEIGL